jgi:hypothetical protein
MPVHDSYESSSFNVVCSAHDSRSTSPVTQGVNPKTFFQEVQRRVQIPVDRLLITISVYTTDLVFQQFTFFFDRDHSLKEPPIMPLFV